MKFNEYLKKLYQSPVFRSVLPMNQGALYPIFFVKNGKLCAHFLAHKTEITKDGMKVYYPEYYMVFTYPECTLIKFERLAYNDDFAETDFRSFELIEKPEKEIADKKRKELSDILQQADNLLSEWDEKKSADTECYNSAYYKILTQKQKEVLEML